MTAVFFTCLSQGNTNFLTASSLPILPINEFGLRDDNESLKAPEVICLGDSYTMGWGVDGEDSFPQRVEAISGLKTLNAGVSSYGTVREFKLLQQLDLSKLKHLILQFDVNDNNENVSFYNENEYFASPRKDYDRIVEENKAAIAYYPFKHVSHFIRSYFEKFLPELHEETNDDEKEEYQYVPPVDAFLNAMAAFQIPDSISIVVFQVGDANTDILIDRLKERIAEGQTRLKNPIYVLDMQSNLSEKHYYLLDQHLNANGHSIVAKKLVDHIKTLP